MGPRILLLQARLPDDPMRQQEQSCFATQTGVPREAITAHDLCRGAPSPKQLRRHDAVMVGGSGEFYISRRNLPHFEGFLDFLREVVRRGHPTFASCFGFQGLIEAMGGEMVHDPDRSEVGTFDLTLTEAGAADPLFGRLPRRFAAQMGHKERAARMGDGAVNLASSDLCRYQALRVPGKPIWATQFHPELRRETNLERFRRYFRDYGPKDPQLLARAEAGFRESPEASSLLLEFMRLALD